MKKRILATPILVLIIFILVGAGVVVASLLIGGAGLPGDVSLQKSLVAHWKFDGNAKDSSSYGNDAAIISSTLTTDRKSTANSAYSFNGTGDRVSASSSSSLQPTTAVTIEFWVKPN